MASVIGLLQAEIGSVITKIRTSAGGGGRNCIFIFISLKMSALLCDGKTIK